MDDSEFLVAVIIFAIIFAFLGSVIAGPKRATAGGILGLLLGPIGLIIAAILRLDSKPDPVVAPQAEPTKRCPQCAETILLAAMKCRFCGADVSATVPPSTQPWR